MASAATRHIPIRLKSNVVNKQQIAIINPNTKGIKRQDSAHFRTIAKFPLIANAIIASHFARSVARINAKAQGGGHKRSSFIAGISLL
jgi:hypothetical protein